MNKTFIALSLASIFAAPAFCAVEVKQSEIEEFIKENKVSVMTDSSGADYFIANGEVVAKYTELENGTIAAEGIYEDQGKAIAINVDKFGNGKIAAVEGNNAIVTDIKVTPRNGVRPEPKPDPRITNIKVSEIETAFDEMQLAVDNNGKVTRHGEEVGKVVADNDAYYAVKTTDLQGNDVTVVVDKETGIVVTNQTKDGEVNTDIAGVIVDDSITPEPTPTPVPPAPHATEELEKIWDAGNHAYNEAGQAYSDLDSRIEGNTKRIDSLEQDMVKMGNKMLDLEDRMDGVVATSHAVTNARPMVQDAGEFAMGVGIGAAGSKQALALGGAYQFNSNWSASTTVNYETAGKRSKSQLSAGAGLHYRFK